MGFHEVLSEVHDHLALLLLRFAGISDLGELDLDPANIRSEARELAQFSPADGVHCWIDGHVTPTYEDIHGHLRGDGPASLLSLS